jgi:hypothetical protein
MIMQHKLISIALLAFICASQCEKLIMTVAFCPTDFSSKGALVQVNPQTGGFTVLQVFDWPQEVSSQGCIALDDPTFAFNYQKSELLLDFTELFGGLVTLSLVDASTSYVTPADAFFTGFYNMVYVGKNRVRGLSGTVANNPEWCSNGCFELAELDLATGNSKVLNLIPFKAVMDDSHVYDPKTNTFWVQASYDLRPINETCGPSQEDLCLLNIDANTGALRNAMYTPNWTAYRYGPLGNANNVLTFIEGTEQMCHTGPDNDFLFGSVNLNTATATVSACLAQNIIIHEAPWCSSFSLDSSMLATASGDAEGNSQLLILNTATGNAVVNANINALAKVLGAAENMFWIWSLNFVAS